MHQNTRTCRVYIVHSLFKNVAMILYKVHDLTTYVFA